MQAAVPPDPQAGERAGEPPILAIVGPTAVGKSALALALAEELGKKGRGGGGGTGGEIINADALQVYRGFDIGTAKPTAEERRRVPHHLIDILEPHQVCSAGDFARRARLAIGEIQGRGKVPIVVGGSGLYFRALFSGLSPIPPGDPEIRRALRERLAGEGLEPLRRELAHLDPITAGRLQGGDTQRILRALEVVLSSGEPLSSWIARHPTGTRSLPGILLGLTLPRTILYDRIERRVARMFEAGWVREVKRLLESGLSPLLPAFQAIGYREIAQHFSEGLSLEKARHDIVRATRRFAKRQLTWFRKEPRVVWFQQLEPEKRIEQVLAFIQDRGVGGS